MSGAGATSALLAKVLAARETWCELRAAGDGKPALRVCIRRPPETDFPRLRRLGGVNGQAETLALVSEYAVGWDGFSEAELFGAAVGSSDPLPFDSAAWGEIVRDRVEWVSACIGHIAEEVNTYIQKKGAAAKN